MVSSRVFAVTLPSSALIPVDHMPPAGIWESAGVEGGVPDRQVNRTICADVTQGGYHADKTGFVSASSEIQRAINTCPERQVVFIPAGTYLIDVPLAIEKSITLRGTGSTTVFQVSAPQAVFIGGLGNWPAPKNNPSYRMPITGGAMRGNTTVNVAHTASLAVGKMVMIDELDDASFVWAQSGTSSWFRASMHLVESKTPTSVTFRPGLPIDYVRSPQLSWFSVTLQNVGVEDIKFVGFNNEPATWNFARII